MKHTLLSLMIAAPVLITTVAATPAVAQGSEAGSNVVGSSAPHPALAPVGASTPTSPAASPLDTYCLFYTRFDDVHWSSTAGDVSGHGWWDNGDCPAGTRANITTYLEEYFSDGVWRTRNVGTKKNAYSGGGSANRANARVTCTGSAEVSWRTVTDIDLINISDTNNVGISDVVAFPCSVN